MTTRKNLNIHKQNKTRISKIHKSKIMKGGNLSSEEIIIMKEKEIIDLDLIRGIGGVYITKLTSDNLNEFSSMLSTNKKVKEISLKNYDQPEEIKPTIDKILKMILSGLEQTTTLVKLDLNWSSIHNEGFKYLIKFINTNNTLKELYIGDCVFIDLDNLNLLVQSLSNNTSLLVCDYYGHHKDEIMPQIQQIMNRNKKIYIKKFTNQLQKHKPEITQDSVEYILTFLDYKDYPMVEHNTKNNNNNNLNMTFMES